MAHPHTIRPQDLFEHLDWAKRLARRLVTDDQIADDVVQDSVLAALRTPPEADRPVRPWLARVVANAVRQRGRAEGRRRRREEAVARPEGLIGAAETAQRAEAQRMLIDAVLGLDAEARDTVLLRYFDGLSAAEIARRTGVPAGTVRSRLKRALDRLRSELDALHGGDREPWRTALLPLAGVSLSRSGRAGGATAATGSFLGAALVLVLGTGAVLALVALLRSAGPGAGRTEPVTFARQVAELDRSAAAPQRDGAPGTAPRGERVELGDDTAAESEMGTDAATPLTQVTARFVDAHGAPVSGVTGRSGSARSLPSGVDGRIALDIEPGSLRGPRALRIVGPGIAADTVAFDAPEPGDYDLGDVLVHPGGAIEGRVLDESGAPLADLEVRVAGRLRSGGSVGGMVWMSATEIGAARDRTDDEGRFRLEGVSAGRVQVEVASDDELRRATSGEVEVRVGHVSQGLEIVAPILDPATRIEGIVLGPDGEPVPYARIRSEWSRWFTKSSGGSVAGRDGRFRLIVESGVDVDLWFDAHDAPAARFLGDVPAGTLDLEVRLVEPLTLRITARGASGQVLTVATAVTDGDDVRGSRWGSASAAAEDGVIELPAAPVPFEVLVRAPGHAERRVGPFEPDAAPETLSVELEPIETLDGRVLGGRAPVEGATVEVRRVARDRVHVGGLPSLAEPSPSAEVPTDAEGGFSLTVRESGRYYVRAEAPGFAPTEFGPLALDPERPSAPLVLELDAGGSLAGTVLDGDGARQRRVLLLSRGDGTTRTLRTDPKGRYRADHLAPGPWFVRVIDEPSQATSSTSTSVGSAFRSIDGDCIVTAGETTWYDPVVGSLAPRAAVRGRLALEGEDPAQYTFELVPAGPGTGQLVPVNLPHVAPDGTFVAHGGAPGPHHLRVQRDGLTFVVELELGAGETPFALEADFGTVRTAPGVSPERHKLLWRGPDGLMALGPMATEGEARRFPAGRVQRVDERGIFGPHLEGLEVLDEVTLAPGGELTVGR